MHGLYKIKEAEAKDLCRDFYIVFSDIRPF